MSDRKNKLNILVLGGNGFIGSAIVSRLQPYANVVIGTRQREQSPAFKTVKLHQLTDAKNWLAVINGFDVVINSVGILRERLGESYKAVHTDAVSALAKACKTLDIRLIHISALGLSANANSRFIKSKYYGEQAIIDSGAKATIVRPSLLDGEGGYGAKWFRRVADWPIHFVMQSAGEVAPLTVTDLGEAIAKLIVMPVEEVPAVAELGSISTYTIPEYLALLRGKKKQSKAMQINMPRILVRMVSHVFDVLYWTPLSFGHYELMQGYNAPSVNLLPVLLGRMPSEFGECQLAQISEEPLCAVKS